MTKASDIRAAIIVGIEPFRSAPGSEALIKTYYEMTAHLDEFYPGKGDEIDPETGDETLKQFIDKMLNLLPVDEKTEKKRRDKAWEMLDAAQHGRPAPDVKVVDALRATLTKFSEALKKPQVRARAETSFSDAVVIRSEVEKKIGLEIGKKLQEVHSLTQGLADAKRKNPLGSHEQLELSVLETNRDFHYLNLMKSLNIEIACCVSSEERKRLSQERDSVKTLLATPSKHNLDALAAKGLDKALIEKFQAAEATIQSFGGKRLLGNASTQAAKPAPTTEQEKRGHLSRMMSKLKQDKTHPAPAPDHPDTKKSHRLSWGRKK